MLNDCTVSITGLREKRAREVSKTRSGDRRGR